MTETDIREIQSLKPSGNGKLSKYKVRKLWETLFPPTCFGDEWKSAKCINKYFKESTPEKKVLPCKYYDKCISECIRKEIARTVARLQESEEDKEARKKAAIQAALRSVRKQRVRS